MEFLLIVSIAGYELVSEEDVEKEEESSVFEHRT